MLKDMKNAIGMGVGNAFTKAVDVVIASGHLEGQDDVSKILEQVVEIRDLFFKSNQQKIHDEFQDWLKQNEDEIDAMLGIASDVAKPL